MHSFLISNFKFQISNSTDVLVIKTEGSIGIAEVRQIQGFLSRKPMQAERNTIYIVAAHTLTVTAQNALLKTLEEPPGNAEIYLVTEFPDLLLPTVLSRVQILDNVSQPENIDISEIKKLVKQIKKAGVGERLELVDDQNFTRESALEFLVKLEYLVHQGITNHELPTMNYELIVQTRKYLQANVNVKLAMDNLFLLLPQPSP